MRRRGSAQAASPRFRYRTAAAANVTSLCEGACPRHILQRRRRRLGGSEAGDTGCCAQPGVPAPSICVASSGLVVARLTPPLFHQQPDGGVGGWGTRGLHKRVQLRIQRPFLCKHPMRVPAGCCDASRFNFFVVIFSQREGRKKLLAPRKSKING